MYKKLIEFHKAGRISFKYVKTFNMDEYVGELDHRNSFFLTPEQHDETLIMRRDNVWLNLHFIQIKQTDNGFRSTS
jgi:6-phosphogluconolactonase/glucosamine-6-phosphate isomerase/deaminase